jgi:hypothetical protein
MRQHCEAPSRLDFPSHTNGLAEVERLIATHADDMHHARE